MGAPEGGLKQCAKGWGPDRTSGGGACVSKARFPFVKSRTTGGRLEALFIKISDCVSGPLTAV